MNRLHEKGSAQLKYSLISNALCPVLDIDDATALKAVFRQNMLHNFVIPMCIHTDILKMFKAPVQTGFRYDPQRCHYRAWEPSSGIPV